MIVKFRALLTLDIQNVPHSEKAWEDFNMLLESAIEKKLESLDYIDTAEIVMEEV